MLLGCSVDGFKGEMSKLSLDAASYITYNNLRIGGEVTTWIARKGEALTQKGVVSMSKEGGSDL